MTNGANGVDAVDLEELQAEIERYLVAVDGFRLEGCEPRWSSADDDRASSNEHDRGV
jgi:hypothetical protein